MKRFFYLLSIAGFMALTACDPEQGNDNGGSDLPEGVSVQAEATAGTKVTVKGTGFSEDAKFYLKDASGNDIELKAEVLSAGAEVTLPYNLGDFTMYVDQSGETVEVGKITVQITGVSCPSRGAIGKTITVTGNGFNPEGKLYAKQKDAAKSIDLKSTYANGIITATIPAETPKGIYTLYYEQSKGSEYTLTDNFQIAKQKRMMNFTEEMKMDAGDGTLMTAMRTSYEFSDNQFTITIGMLNEETFELDEMPLAVFDVIKSESAYTFTDALDNGMDFTLNVKGGKVMDAGSEAWEYNAEGYLIKANTSVPNELSYDELGNYADASCVFENPELINTPFAIDVAVLSNLSMIFENDPIIASAYMLGLGGRPSVNYPSDGMIEKDSDGFIVEYTIDRSATEGMIISYTYVYEE